jgi:BlaI family transcriptional regulator, penicillinase repressor
MKDEPRVGLSEAEREALRALWDHGSGTVRQIRELFDARGRQWAYSTVATLLRRLETKGYAASELDGGTLVYSAALSRGELLDQRLNDAAIELCEGAAVPLVLALVQGKRISVEDLDRIRQIIDEARKDHEKAPKRRK